MASLWERLEKLMDRPLTTVERALFISAAGFTAVAGVLLTRDSLSLLSAIGAATTVAIALFGISLGLLRPPKAPRGTVGILVALAPETEAYALQLRSDFTNQMRRLVESQKLSRKIAIVEWPQRLAGGVTSEEASVKALVASRCQLAIYGEARERTVQGKPQHVLTPRLTVSHRPISLARSAEFGGDLSKVVPTPLVISREGDFIGFALASHLVLLAAQYAIAVASFISLELDYSEELFRQLEAGITRLPQTPAIVFLHEAIPRHLRMINGVRAVKAWRLWDRTRDRNHLVGVEQNVDAILALKPTDEFALLGKAVAAFVLRRDTALARKCVDKCRSSSTGTWRYSDAFLHLYGGRLDRARAAYRKASRAPTEELSDYLQSEVFLAEVLEEEPERIQLWFGIGVINLFMKGDLTRAKHAFGRFRELDTKIKFGPYHIWAEDELEKASRTAQSVSESA